MNLHPHEYAKAIVGGLLAGLSVLAGAVGDGVSAEEWIATAVAVLLAFGAVFNVENKPPRGRRRKANVSEMEPDAGHSYIEVLGAVVLALVALALVLWIFTGDAQAGVSWK